MADEVKIHAHTNSDAVSTAFRHRIRMLNDESGRINTSMSFVGSRLEDGANQNQVTVKFVASEGDRSFGDQFLLSSTGGCTDLELVWAVIQVSLDPSDIMNVDTDSPRAMRIYLEHPFPCRGNRSIVLG